MVVVVKGIHGKNRFFFSTQFSFSLSFFPCLCIVSAAAILPPSPGFIAFILRLQRASQQPAASSAIVLVSLSLRLCPTLLLRFNLKLITIANCDDDDDDDDEERYYETLKAFCIL